LAVWKNPIHRAVLGMAWGLILIWVGGCGGRWPLFMKWSELFGAPRSNQQRQKTATAARDPRGERSIVKNEDVTPCFLKREYQVWMVRQGPCGRPRRFARSALGCRPCLPDGFGAGPDGVALGHVNGAEHSHFQIHSGVAHE
jgi:hypothetical protein